MELAENWKENLESIDPMDVEQLGKLVEYIEYNTCKRNYDFIEKLITTVSNKSLLQAIIYADGSHLELFKKLFNLEYKFNKSYWGDEDTKVSDCAILNCALVWGKVDIVKYLMEEKKIHLPYKYLFNFLSDDRDEDKAEVTLYLLKSGRIDVNFDNGNLLIWAIKTADYTNEKIDYEVVKYLIEQGADLSMNNFEPLNLMCENGLFNDIIKDIVIKSYKQLHQIQD
jgi:hypothetical protein